MVSASRSLTDASHGGHNYLASVSDLVSALIFIFIIMLAVFAYQLANVTKDLNVKRESLEAEGKTRDRILQDIKSRLEKSGMRVEVLSEQGVLRLSDNAINFPSGKDTPVDKHRINVGRLAQAIAEVAPCYVSMGGKSDVVARAGDVPLHCQPPADAATYPCSKQEYPWRLETLLIEGHTDKMPVAEGHRFKNNLELSSMRAATVHRLITACEPGITGLKNSDGAPILSTSGYGETRPVANGDTQPDAPGSEQVEDARRVNRRIDLRFLMEPPEGALAPAETPVQTEVRERYEEGQP